MGIIHYVYLSSWGALMDMTKAAIDLSQGGKDNDIGVQWVAD